MTSRQEKKNRPLSYRVVQEKVKIVLNEALAPSFFRLVFESPLIAASIRPGQFLHIRPRPSSELLLRRPFSAHQVTGDETHILYKVVGKGTRLLSEMPAGALLDVIGPLGNGFSLSRAGTDLLVAGGMGVAPLLALAEELARKKDSSTLRLLSGAKTQECLLCVDDFKALNIKTLLATDDGSAGEKALVTEMLERVVRDKSLQAPIHIFACGPRDMLKACAGIAARYDIQCQVSLEEMMACGVGACRGCAIMTKGGYKMVCKDGPVFDAREIIWEDGQ